MRTRTMLLLVLAGILFTLGCSSDEGDVRAVIEAQTSFLNARDVTGYMTTIASESPMRAATEATMRQLAAFDIKYEIEDLQVLNVQEGRAVVRVVQTTRAVGQRPTILFTQFQDNRMTAEHTLIKESKGWKVQSSAVIKSEVPGSP